MRFRFRSILPPPSQFPNHIAHVRPALRAITPTVQPTPPDILVSDKLDGGRNSNLDTADNVLDASHLLAVVVRASRAQRSAQAADVPQTRAREPLARDICVHYGFRLERREVGEVGQVHAVNDGEFVQAHLLPIGPECAEDARPEGTVDGCYSFDAAGVQVGQG